MNKSSVFYRMVCLTTLLAIAQSALSQNKMNDVSLEAGGGKNSLNATFKDGTTVVLPGSGLRLSFSHFLKNDWGFGSGIGIRTFASTSTVNFTESTQDIDSEGDGYLYKTVFKDWSEKQQSLQLEIPLEAKYRHFFNSRVGMTLSCGVNVMVPLKNSYETTGGEMTSSAYYPQWDVELKDLPQHGFSTVTSRQSGAIGMKTYVSAIFEYEWFFQLSKGLFLSTGVYGTYGLSKIKTLNYNALRSTDGTYNGLMDSHEMTNVKPYSLGAKIGLQIPF